MVARAALYELQVYIVIVHANMPEVLPSLSTVERDAKKRYTVLSKGEFQLGKLVAHLEAYNAERIATISEDATDEQSKGMKMILEEWGIDTNKMKVADLWLVLSSHLIISMKKLPLNIWWMRKATGVTTFLSSFSLWAEHHRKGMGK